MIIPGVVNRDLLNARLLQKIQLVNNQLRCPVKGPSPSFPTLLVAPLRNIGFHHDPKMLHSILVSTQTYKVITLMDNDKTLPRC